MPDSEQPAFESPVAGRIKDVVVDPRTRYVEEVKEVDEFLQEETVVEKEEVRMG